MAVDPDLFDPVWLLPDRFLREAAEILARAFARDPLTRCIYGPLPPEKQIPFQRCIFESVVLVAHYYGAILGSFQEQSLCGVAVLYGPNQYSLPFLGRLLNAWGPLLIGRRYRRRYMAFDRFRLARRSHERHWHLHTLAVDPCQQRQGHGRALLDFLSDQADYGGLPCYLETTSRENLSFYWRGGYEVVHRDLVPGLAGLTMWTLRREPDPNQRRGQRAGD